MSTLASFPPVTVKWAIKAWLSLEEILSPLNFDLNHLEFSDAELSGDQACKLTFSPVNSSYM